MRAIAGLPLVPILVLVPAAAIAATGELNFGRMLLQTVLSLGLVCLLAVVVLRLLARSGLGGGRSDGSRMDVIERVGVGPRQTLLAVRVLDRVVVVGQSPAGLARLAEVSFAQWQSGGRGFAAVLDEAPPATHELGTEPAANGEIVA